MVCKLTWKICKEHLEDLKNEIYNLQDRIKTNDEVIESIDRLEELFDEKRIDCKEELDNVVEEVNLDDYISLLQNSVDEIICDIENTNCEYDKKVYINTAIELINDNLENYIEENKLDELISIIDDCIKFDQNKSNQNRKKRNTSKGNEERNKKIFELYKLGKSYSQIAQEFELSKTGISKIINKMKEKVNSDEI